MMAEPAANNGDHQDKITQTDLALPRLLHSVNHGDEEISRNRFLAGPCGHEHNCNHPP